MGRLTILVVKGLLVLVQSYVAQQSIVQVTRQSCELGTGVPVLKLLHPVGHQRGILLRGPVSRFRRQVLMIARGYGAFRAQRAGEVLPLTMTRNN